MSDAAVTAAGPPAAAWSLPDSLGEDLGWLLNQVHHGYSAASAAAVSRIPGGLRGLQILGAALDGAAPSQIEVARRLGIDRTVMVRLVDKLEQAGLVERHPDPADRRARIITATELGAWLHTAIQEDRRLVDQHILSPLDPAEHAVLHQLLRRVAAHLLAVDPTRGSAACDKTQRAIDAQADVDRSGLGGGRSRNPAL